MSPLFYLVALSSSSPSPMEPPAPGALYTAARGLAELPDPFGVEADLWTHGVAPTQATLLRVAGGEGGPPALRVESVSLASGARRRLASGARIACVPLPRGDADLLRSGVLLHPASGDPPRSPGILLVEGHPAFGSLVVLLPGDVAEVRETLRDGRIVRSRLTLRRPADTLEIVRDGGGQRICYSQTEAG